MSAVNDEFDDGFLSLDLVLELRSCEFSICECSKQIICHQRQVDPPMPAKIELRVGIHFRPSKIEQDLSSFSLLLNGTGPRTVIAEAIWPGGRIIDEDNLLPLFRLLIR
jgi:hypothetical protein